MCNNSSGNSIESPRFDGNTEGISEDTIAKKRGLFP
jgi:hypothetical protein